jgi:hypothetical protein
VNRQHGHHAKPTPAGLGVDLAALEWKRSGAGDGSIEVAFPLGPASRPAAWEHGEWVLMRIAGDPAGRVLVFDRNEWACFLDGVRNGEFDDASSALAGCPGGDRPGRVAVPRRWNTLRASQSAGGKSYS